ncbi:MAG: tetratricopeptide repeat protein [Polyangiaceae bacterium]|nr:tetratricopeptide repeat protein [Polyangiaceae bacterium]
MLATIIILSSNAWATCPPEAFSSETAPESLKAPAQLLYDEADALLAKEPKDYAKAFELFMKSRAVYPSPDNSLMAALCLRELGRYPEALALYEEILIRFDEKLDPKERVEFKHYIDQLRQEVVIAYVDEREGSFSIDDDACGSLPRSKPIYLMPGTHLLRVLLPGKPESTVRFSGQGGDTLTLQIPVPPPPPPPSGKWFVQATVGPAIGWSGIDLGSVGLLSPLSGVLAQSRGGYRLPSDVSLGLAMGLLYAWTPGIPNGFFNTGITLYHSVPLFAPFMGISIAWEPSIDNRLNAFVRAGSGLMGAQSKNEVNARHLGAFGPIDDFGLAASGREIERSVPAYATFDIGASLRVGPATIGLSMGALFLLAEGPLLPEMSVRIVKDPLFTKPLERTSAYRPSFLFIPQVVFGFDP